ncbi:MAG: hypothetical protein ACRDTF_15100 [Pseudonocardiaceae bacterium]
MTSAVVALSTDLIVGSAPSEPRWSPEVEPAAERARAESSELSVVHGRT